MYVSFNLFNHDMQGLHGLPVAVHTEYIHLFIVTIKIFILIK